MDTKDLAAVLGKMRINVEQATTKMLQLYEQDTGCRIEQIIVVRDFEAAAGGAITGVKLTVVVP